MSAVLRFPLANPVRIVRTSFNGLNYNDPENLLFHQFSKPNIRSWCQPFAQTDTIYFHFDSSFDTNSIKLINYFTGEVVYNDNDLDPALYEDETSSEFEGGDTAHFNGSDESSTEIIAIESGYSVFEGYYPMTIPAGCYYFVGEGGMNDGSAYYRVESELIEVKPEWKNSVKIQYYSNEPNFGIDWRTGKTFEIRVRGDFMKIFDQNTVDNAVSSSTRLTKIKDYFLQGRILELYEHVPSWYAQKINFALGMDVVTIDGKIVISPEKPEFQYESQGLAWVKPSWSLLLSSNDLINRHDSSTRLTY